MEGPLGEETPPRRVLVADDRDVLRIGLRHVLAAQPWVSRCVAVAHGREAVALAARWEPHVTLLGARAGAGPALVRELRSAAPDTRVLLVADAIHVSRETALAVGAVGVVSVRGSADDVVSAVRAAVAVRPRQRRRRRGRVSDRELEVLSLLAQGVSNAEIARRLSLSPHTVRGHTSSLYRKLGVPNRAAAALHAAAYGLV